MENLMPRSTMVKYASLGIIPLLVVVGVVLFASGSGLLHAAASPLQSDLGTYPGHGPKPDLSQQQIDAAVAAPLLAFVGPSTSSHMRPGTAPTAVYGAKAVYFLALTAYYYPGAHTSDGTRVLDRLVAQIGNLVAGGNEPDANGGLEGWSHNAVAQALLLVHSEPYVWNRLTSVQQAHVDLLMTAMAVAANFDYNDANNFKTGLDELCNFGKTFNPNYREGYLGLMIAASQYFGAAQLNTILTSFDYTSFTQALHAAGFTNILATWAESGATLMMQGGNDTCGGNGVGVRVPFVYQGVSLSDPVGIFAKLANFTYNETVVSRVDVYNNKNVHVGQAGIADGTTSPYEGQSGMEREFDSSDSGGTRSDALYAYEGWMNSVTTRTTLTVLDQWGCGATQQQVEQEMGVGSGDLIYKLQHGYNSYSGGKFRLVNETTPASDGPAAKGYFFDEQMWQNILAAAPSC